VEFEQAAIFRDPQLITLAQTG